MSLRILYIHNGRFPSETANSLQVAKTCEAFHELGLEIELWHPLRRQTTSMKGLRDSLAYYGINGRFKIREVRMPDFLNSNSWLNPLFFYIQTGLFAYLAAQRIKNQNWNLLLMKDYALAFFFTLFCKDFKGKIGLECHSYPQSRLEKKLHLKSLRKVDRIFPLTEALKEIYLVQGIDESKLHVARNAVDPALFEIDGPQEEHKRRLGFSSQSFLIVYTGHLYPSKAVETLVDAAAYLPNSCEVVIAGGTKADHVRLLKRAVNSSRSKITFIEHQNPDQVISYQRAADLLVLPMTFKQSPFYYAGSPLKLFEYMAARRPILASRTPSIEEILRHDHNAWLVSPDDPIDLAQAIQTLMKDTKLRERLSHQACLDAQSCTWEKRALGMIRSFDLESQVKVQP